jgi:hypothetical protein
MKKVISILSICLIFSFTSLYAEVDGYKNFKFGMKYDDVYSLLEDLVKNNSNKKCEIANVSRNTLGTGRGCFKILGKRDIKILFTESGLSQINFDFHLPFDKKLWKMLTKSVGKKYKFYKKTIKGIDTPLTSFEQKTMYEGCQVYTYRSRISKIETGLDRDWETATLYYIDKTSAKKCISDLIPKKIEKIKIEEDDI